MVFFLQGKVKCMNRRSVKIMRRKAGGTAEQICIENKVDEILDTAFGVNETPSWEDFLAFLADRCIPKTRKGLDYYLDAVGVPKYDPVLLVEKTQGRMAEDHKWLEII